VSAKKTPTTSNKRTKTARAIQRATLQLAVDHGYKAVTIDMIAEHAGISRRTFFNHYKNKQDAIVGPKIDRLGNAYDWFATSEKPLLHDLQCLVRQVITDASPDPLVIRTIGTVLGDTPDLQPEFSAMITNFTHELAPLLSQRFGNGQEPAAHLISHLVSHAIVLSFQEWTAGNEITLDQIVDEANSNIRCAVRALAPT
jgi:AcrR family transcriptional regulator